MYILPLLIGGDTEAASEHASAEENDQASIKHDVNKMTDKRSAKIIWSVALNKLLHQFVSKKKAFFPLL